MADTLESVYLNTSLGATELDDGEHTIVTTDSATRYVIKDMYVNGTTDLTGTYLELNGFNVGSIAKNATGSLIIPPSSTLKIKSTDYPYSFYSNVEYALSNIYTGFKESYTNSKGTQVGSSFEYYQSTQISNYANVTDMAHTVQTSNGNDFLHYAASDQNSSQQLYYVSPTGTNSQNLATSYRPFGLWGGKAWVMSGGTALNVMDLEASPTTSSDPSANFGGQKSNSYNPYTTSSYPRARAAHGFYFYTPSSGYTSDLYGINLTNGSFHKFQCATYAWTMSSNYANFVVSIDEENDKMYLYTPTNSNTVLNQHVFDNWSNIVAIDNTSNPNTHNSASANQDSSHTSSGGAHWISSAVSRGTMGYDPYGGFFYFNTSGERVHVDKSWNVLEKTSSFVVAGNTISTGGGHIFMKKQKLLTSAEATAASLSAPTFGIQLLGVKSV